MSYCWISKETVVVFWALIASCMIEEPYGDQCCGSESESGSESERIRAFLAGTESEIFVPDSDSDPNSDPDPVPDPVI